MSDEKDPKELGIPDLSEADELKSLYRVREHTQLQESTEHVEDEPAEEASDEEKEIKNPHARARILQQERDRSQRDQEILAARLRYVLDTIPNIVAQQVNNQEVEQEVEITDEDLDPITALNRKLDKINEKIDNAQQDQFNNSAQHQNAAALQRADALVAGAVQSSREFVGAIEHLSRIVLNDLDDKYPHYTDAEKHRVADEAIQHQKIQWVRSGRNPVEEFYKKALIMGYDPSRVVKAEPKDDKTSKKPDAKAQIRNEKDKAERMNSIGGAPGGAAVRRHGLKELAEMSEAQYNEVIQQGVKDGIYKNRPGRRGPSISEVLREAQRAEKR